MINVIGLGYIGLPTALMLAANGNEVIGTDINVSLVENLNSGMLIFNSNEKGLEDLFRKALDKGIKFSSNYHEADIYIVSVPTPYNKLTKCVDLSYVLNAIRNILELNFTETIVVIESTVSPGSIDKLIRPIIVDDNLKRKRKIHLVHAPERIIPGNMIYELTNNARTIGCDSTEIGQIINKYYSSFCKGNILLTSIKIAEMSKVIENTFRAVNIAFANELTKICRRNNLDTYSVIEICNQHPRVNILQPGPGVGGHCIPVDPWFLVGDFPDITNLIKESMIINSSMPEYVLMRIYEIMIENKLNDFSRIGLYGLTYKEDIDDYRESPTLQLLDIQRCHLAPLLKSYDPFISDDLVDNQYHDLYRFINDIDFIVIMVGHLQIIRSQELLKEKIILDTKNIITLDGVYHL